jgi:hypothetical protein
MAVVQKNLIGSSSVDQFNTTIRVSACDRSDLPRWHRADDMAWIDDAEVVK